MNSLCIIIAKIDLVITCIFDYLLLFQINLGGNEEELLFNTPDLSSMPGPATKSGTEVDLLSDLDVLGAAGGVPKHAYTHPARQEAEREEQEEREQIASSVRYPLKDQEWIS